MNTKAQTLQTDLESHIAYFENLGEDTSLQADILSRLIKGKLDSALIDKYTLLMDKFKELTQTDT